jgi:hypothetical protein
MNSSELFKTLVERVSAITEPMPIAFAMPPQYYHALILSGKVQMGGGAMMGIPVYVWSNLPCAKTYYNEDDLLLDLALYGCDGDNYMGKRGDIK